MTNARITLFTSSGRKYFVTLELTPYEERGSLPISLVENDDGSICAMHANRYTVYLSLDDFLWSVGARITLYESDPEFVKRTLS